MLHSMAWSARIVLLVLFLTFVTAQEEESPKRRKKVDTRPCPDTCTLKRRIGKIELRFENDVSEVKTACLSEIGDLRAELSGTNFTAYTPVVASGSVPAFNGSVGSGFSQLRRNITAMVDSKLERVVVDLKGEYRAGQEKLEETYAKVRELAQSVTSGVQDDAVRTSQQRELDLRNTIGLMNRTLHALQIQNVNLQRQTQAVRTQTATLRAQNDVLTEDNRDLRRRIEERRPEVKEARLEEIEADVSQQSTSVRSLEQQLEWITNRVNSLADSVDSAVVEAASASETANRAAAVSKQAISIARGRPVNNDEGVAEEETTERAQPEIPPTDCWELYQMGYTESGVYTIKPWRARRAFDVYCEQQYNGGGWTLIQRRRDGSVDFDRNWEDYANGFGSLEGEMWLGNEKIHTITRQDTYVMQVLLLDWEGNRAYAEYEGFRVQSSADYYSVRFGNFNPSSSAGDGLRGTLEDGSRNLYLARFTTADTDNDSCRPCMDNQQAFENCADLQGGGWWFRACSDSNINGRYITPENFNQCHGRCYGIQWRTWHEEDHYSLKATIMLVRPISRE